MRRFFARKKGGTKNESSWTSVEKKTESRKIDKLDPNYILAHTSEITGIPNGRQYRADMAELETDAGTPPLRCVFSLDMANLKILNEEKLGGVGHEAADKVLEFFARELQEAVDRAVLGTAPVVLHNSYHMHGDEFCALVASTMPDAGAFQAAMEKLENAGSIRSTPASSPPPPLPFSGQAHPRPRPQVWHRRRRHGRRRCPTAHLSSSMSTATTGLLPTPRRYSTQRTSG